MVPRCFPPLALARSQRAFSLVELLVVVAIFVLLMTISGPSFSNFGKSQGVSEAAYQIAAAIDHSRNEAIARNAYVWLAIEDEVEAGTRQLRVGSALVKDGNPSNTSADNFVPLLKPFAIQRVGLASSQTDVLSGAEELASHTGGAKFKFGKADFKKGCSILFSPTGEVALNAPQSGEEFRFTELVALGIQSARGTQTLDEKNFADIGIEGSTGTPQIFRPTTP